MLTKTQVASLRRVATKARNRVGIAMDLAGVTQVELAERTGFTQGYISKVKAGEYADLPGETMRTFATAFGCAIEDLFPARQAVAS